MLNYQKIINDHTASLSQPRLNLAHNFLSEETRGKRYLFGRNETSAQLAKSIEIDGFIDDYAELGTYWHGKPVLKSENVPENAIIVNCVLAIRPTTAEKRIKNLGFSEVIPYCDLYQLYPDTIPLPTFVLETRLDLSQNQDQWEKLSQKLADNESRIVLDDILKFRLTGDYHYLSNYQFRPWDQYFEDFIPLDEAIFVDCGGFDGDTTEQFCQRYPNYDKVYLFEPSSENMEKAKQRLQRFRDIQFILFGVSDQQGKLWFNSDGGSASCVSDSGLSQISVTTLDQSIEEKVTFIKMDLEGWELKALHGSIKHIKEDHPILAIAVYHHPSDFWRIPEFVLSVQDDYDIFLRHYTEAWTETIMYFVPR